MKSTRASGLVLAGVLGLAGLGVGATLGPVAASAATGSTQAVSDRLTEIKDALAGLVKNGTITQAQADKVATTLDSNLPKGGFGGHGGRGGFGRGADLDTAASVIGITTDQLRTALDSGKTLAQVAQSKGVSQATLVDKLVAAEKTRISAAVKAGQLTQAQADTRIADLKTRITEQVTTTCAGGGRGPGGGHDGDGYPGGPGASTAPTTPTPAPTASSTTS